MQNLFVNKLNEGWHFKALFGWYVYTSWIWHKSLLKP